MDDEMILKYIQQGDQIAFENMIRRYYTTLCAFANHMIKDPDSAEDIIQELFVKLWTNRCDLGSVKSLKDYLFISARNHTLTFLRGRERFINHLKQLPLEDEHDFSTYAIEEENNRLLLEAIEHLPPRSSEVIKLSLEGMKQEKIAERMSISINTVKSLKYEAIQRLRQELAPLIYLFLHCKLYPQINIPKPTYDR